MEEINDYDFERHVVLSALISRSFECKETGIAKLALDKGYETLSSKQKYVLDKFITKYYPTDCKRCGIQIPISEFESSLDNGGICGYCEHMISKIEKD